MKRNRKLTLKAVLFVLISLFYSTVEAQIKSSLPQLGKSSLKQVVAAMSLQEKAKWVIGMGFKLPGMLPPTKGELPKSFNIAGFTSPATDPGAYNVPGKIAGSSGPAHAILR